MQQFLSSIHHIDHQLQNLIQLYGKQIYIILALIIFLKTAFIIFTFLPGDATLFASGTLAALGLLDIKILLGLFILATLAGDLHNYMLGRLYKKLKQHHEVSSIKFLNKGMKKAKFFLKRYGKSTIMSSRFIPLLSATVPFICGLMRYNPIKFARYNFIGACIWSCIWVSAGYFLGNIPFIQGHLFEMLFIITLISILPIFITIFKNIRKKQPI